MQVAILDLAQVVDDVHVEMPFPIDELSGPGEQHAVGHAAEGKSRSGAHRVSGLPSYVMHRTAILL